MPTNTTNFNLVKPDPSEFYNVAVQNENMDIIDEELKRIEEDSGGVAEVQQDLATHKAERASLTEVGHTQLSSATNSTSEILAATPKAVKAAYDLAQQSLTQANNGKTDIASVVGSPATVSDTFAQLKTHIQNAKNKGATNLTAKGTAATGTESLDALMSKIADVSPGKKYRSGVTSVSSVACVVRGLDFAPTMVLVFIQSSSTKRELGTVLFNPDGTVLRGVWVRGDQNGNPEPNGIQYNDGFQVQFSDRTTIGNIVWRCWE